MRYETKFVFLILATWFGLALTAGMSDSFHNASAPMVAITVWTLTGVALLICWTIPTIRNWATTVDFPQLVGLHITRFVGVYFLVLSARGSLPPGFAKPAGIGDIIVAAAAGSILLFHELRRRKILLVWNTLGLIDIVLVVFGALRFGLRDWLSMAPLRELPLSLLPTFLVPLIIASHILIFIRLGRAQVGPTTPAQHLSAAVLRK